MKTSQVFGLIVTFLMFGSLILSGFAPIVAGQTSVPLASAGQTSCPSTQTLRVTLNGGVPNSLTELTGSTFGALLTGRFLWMTAYPELSPTGTEMWNYSIVDSITPNSNFTQWTFHVKPGLKWSNGQPVTAQDILATYGSNYGFNASFDFVGIHSEVTNEYAANSSAAVFKLSHSDAWFPLLISGIVFIQVIPAAEINQSGPTYTGFGTPIADGPFQTIGYTAGQSQMVLQRNPYWNTTGLPNPKICEVDINYVESDSSADTLLQEGAVDLAPVDPSAVGSVTSNPNVHIMQLLDSEIMSLTYNITSYPTNMTAFRQALVYAIDQNAIVKQAINGYAGTAYSAEGIVPTATTALYNPSQVQYNFNATKALSLLSSIGITKGSDGHLHYINGTTVTLNVWADTEESKDTIAAGLLASNLQAIGMVINTHIVARHIISSATSEAPGSLYLTTGEATVFPSAYVDALPGWDVYTHPAIPTTYWEYPPFANNEYNSNLSALSSTDNPTLVNHYLNNIQSINSQYLPVITLAYPSFLWGYSTQRFVGWGTYPQNFIDAWNNMDYGSFLKLVPVSTSTGSTATSASTTSITSTAITSTGSTATSASTTSSGSLNTYYVLAAVVIVVILAIGAVFFARRRNPK